MTLPKTITTAELMQLDYTYRYSEQELVEDWMQIGRAHV